MKATVVIWDHNEGRSVLYNAEQGKVMVVGGRQESGGVTLNQVDLFDLNTQTWTAGPSMNFKRQYHNTTLLSDGKVPLQATVIGHNAAEHCAIELCFGRQALGQLPSERRELQPVSTSCDDFPEFVSRDFTCIEDSFTECVHCLDRGDSFRVMLEKTDGFADVSCSGHHWQTDCFITTYDLERALHRCLRALVTRGYEIQKRCVDVVCNDDRV